MPAYYWTKCDTCGERQYRYRNARVCHKCRTGKLVREELEVMTTGHMRWKEFIGRLEGPEGCNFRDKKCGGDKTFATAILKRMGGFDVEQSLAYFEKHGGHCDCEIIYNVKHAAPAAAPARVREN